MVGLMRLLLDYGDEIAELKDRVRRLEERREPFSVDDS